PQPISSTSAAGVTTINGVSNYGWCEGDWYVYGGPPGVPNRAAFQPHARRRFSAFTDGLSPTLLGAEVKTHQQACHDCTGRAGSPRPPRPIPGWCPIPPP